MTLPEYIERFVEHHFNAKYVGRVTDEFIAFLSDGEGGSSYTHETGRNLLSARERGIAPERLDYFGQG